MSPEMQRRIPYQPQVADLYALAVLMFAMYMGKMPFNSAVSDDVLFNCIVKRDLNKFWRLHELDVTNP